MKNEKKTFQKVLYSFLKSKPQQRQFRDFEDISKASMEFWQEAVTENNDILNNTKNYTINFSHSVHTETIVKD